MPLGIFSKLGLWLKVFMAFSISAVYIGGCWVCWIFLFQAEALFVSILIVLSSKYIYIYFSFMLEVWLFVMDSYHISGILRGRNSLSLVNLYSGVYICVFVQQTKQLFFSPPKMFLQFSISSNVYVQSWPKILAPLVNMIKEGCEN